MLQLRGVISKRSVSRHSKDWSSEGVCLGCLSSGAVRYPLGKSVVACPTDRPVIVYAEFDIGQPLLEVLHSQQSPVLSLTQI